MMVNSENFKQLVARAMAASDRVHMRPVIEKELLHYDILFALDQNHLLDQLTFQGGTALRLCYGAPRYSEDLDFAGGKNFQAIDLVKIKNCLEAYLAKRYGLTVYVKEPKTLLNNEAISDIHVNKWQLNVITSPERKDLPQQKIKIEVTNIPAYSKEPLALAQNYDFLPDGYANTLVMTETLDEIMADKCISLVNCTRYIRHRDIWDLRWLNMKGARLRKEYIQNKINDYKISDYSEKLSVFLDQLSNIIHGKAFSDEMTRFLPVDTQDNTIKKEKFLIFLTNEISGLFLKVRQSIGSTE